MGYCAASDVAILVPNTLNGQDGFGFSSSPMEDAVITWISSGCAEIEATLAAHKYAPPASTTLLYHRLKDCNAWFAAARVELSIHNMTLAPGERTRGQVFMEYFQDCIGELVKQDLTLMGATRLSSGAIYVGGISKTQKDNNTSDTDNVKPRFERGQFDFTGTIRSSGS